MRVNCPNCAKNVELPDSAAGNSVDCPECGEAFEAPVLWDEPELTPQPEPPPPPPDPEDDPDAEKPYGVQSPPPPTEAPNPYVGQSPPPPVATPNPPPPPPPPVEQSPPPPPPPARSSAVPGERTLSLKLDVVQWVAPVCFLLVLPLTLFTWVQVNPAGESLYTQSLWGAIFADFSINPVGDTLVEQHEAQIKEEIGTSVWFGLPYLLALLAAVIVSLAGPLMPRLKRPLPKVVDDLLPYRTIALAALAGLTFLLLIGLLAGGLSLENAVEDVVDDMVAERYNDETPETEQDRKSRAVNRDSMLGSFRLGTTFWLRTVVLLHLAAMVAVGLELWLRRRGDQPAPTISFRC